MVIFWYLNVIENLIKFSDAFYKVSTLIDAIPISFPKKEWPEIKERLKENGKIVTTRVSDELKKYKPGDICITSWGQVLKVTKVKSYKDISKHPFENELRKKERDIISKYEDFDVIYLSLYKPTE